MAGSHRCRHPSLWRDPSGAAVRISNGSAILLFGELGKDAIKPWSLAKVTHENGCFVHESMGSFFERAAAEKYLTLEQGLPWESGDVVDDYAERQPLASTLPACIYLAHEVAQRGVAMYDAKPTATLPLNPLEADAIETSLRPAVLI